MYRCRRLAAVMLAFVLSLAFVSFFVFYASADDNSQFFIRYQYYISSSDSWSSTYSRPINTGFLTGAGYSKIRIIGFTYRPISLDTPENVYLSFRISGYNSAGQSGQFNVANTNTQLSVVSNSNLRWNYVSVAPSGRGSEIEIEDYKPLNKTCSFTVRFGIVPKTSLFSYQIDLATPYVISCLNDLIFWPYLDNEYFEYENQNEIDYYAYVLDYFTEFVNHLNNIFSSMSSFYNLFSGSYSYMHVSYDPVSGELSMEPQTGGYFDALLGYLGSIAADSEAQAAQQEKARDKGAEDALDAAYEHSSFGAFVDILDISDFGEYDQDVVEDAADGPLDWFSEYNRLQLDSVGEMKGQDDNFVSLYQDNIDSILDILSGDRARRRKAGDP